MREWLKRSPWKGDGVARPPRVRIPQSPPMNTEVKEILGNLIVDIDKRSQQIFEVIEKQPRSLENDRALIQLLDMFASLLETYQSK